MTDQDLEKLIDKNKYQIFVMICPTSLPILFAKHTWFVINKKGVFSKWEVKFNKNENPSYGYLHLNEGRPFQGISKIYPIKKHFFWKGKMLGVIDGDENSIAKKISEFIEGSKEQYKNRDRYSLTGPNSNTYTQWVLNNFPEINIKLPWNCVGKNYKDSQ
ncbi:DUF3750 domain-containing protein [Candidatus Nomurabacteria bacterium]|nr:DUF3750 domain-containing protein [Candidatus Nomurabacteria bacterium]